MPTAKRAWLECARERQCWLGSCRRSWDLHPILSPLSTCLNFPLYPRASSSEGQERAAETRIEGVSQRRLQREGRSGCLQQSSSRPLLQLVLQHPLHLPQCSRVNSLEGSSEPLTHLQGLLFCTRWNSLARALSALGLTRFPSKFKGGATG